MLIENLQNDGDVLTVRGKLGLVRFGGVRQVATGLTSGVSGLT